MMATAFVGYVLPWGQMSYWGATVITNLITAIPYVGNDIACWLWGGFSVENPTLNRFLSIHFLLPFAVLGTVTSHLGLLHETGSSNPLKTFSKADSVNFWPYFGIKDLLVLLIVSAVVILQYILAPEYLGHSDNYIPADPLVTPTHIVPEWYFLPFYAILRAIPDKLGGVVAMLLSILALAFLPVFGNSWSINKSTKFSPIRKVLFWCIVFDFIFLGFIGGNVAEDPFIFAGRLASVFYFALLFLLDYYPTIQRNMSSKCVYNNNVYTVLFIIPFTDQEATGVYFSALSDHIPVEGRFTQKIEPFLYEVLIGMAVTFLILRLVVSLVRILSRDSSKKKFSIFLKKLALYG